MSIDYTKSLKGNNNNQTVLIAALKNLLELSFPGLAYEMLQTWLLQRDQNNIPGTETFTILLELAGRVLEPEEGNVIADWCIESLGELIDESYISQAGMAIYKARQGQTKEAIEWFTKAQKALHHKKEELEKSGKSIDKLLKGQQNIINSGWNLGCQLLKKGEMGLGWEYYNYGLQAPAAGLQRWQRALPKPFDADEVTVWNGESLKDKHLLLMGTSHGDTMMFLRLLPSLQKEVKKITMTLPERLIDIYKRTYPDIAIVNELVSADALKANDYDYQIPSGSVPNLRLHQWIKEGWEQKKLLCQDDLAKSLRKKYLTDAEPKTILVGVSWLGGGKSERLRSKSIPPEQFSKIMEEIPNARFISLQYGRCESQIEAWRHQGIDILYDKTINPLKDMDQWLAQVDSCDAVISVANTTIHGSGGLNKPTLCLQSRTSDWRWIDGLDCSYWYKSVDSLCQRKDGSWDSVCEQVNPWLENIRTGQYKEDDQHVGQMHHVMSFIKYDH